MESQHLIKEFTRDVGLISWVWSSQRVGWSLGILRALIELCLPSSWRFTQDPASSVAQIYKKEYFQKTQLLEAKLGNYHSLI